MKTKLIAAAVLVAALAGGIWLQMKTSGVPGVETAPRERIAFSLPDLEGNMRDFEEWEGKARLVNFWATWCAPCRREIPLLKELQAQHGDDTLQVIGIAVDYQEDVLAYARTAEFNYPVLVGQEDAMAAAETAGRPFEGLPVTMLVSAEGELIKLHLGEIFEPQIERIVDVAERLQRGELDLAGAREALGRF